MKSYVLLALLTCAMLSTKVLAEEYHFWIFLCFGQSNMEGFPGIEEQDKIDVDDRFKVFAAVDFPKRNGRKGTGTRPCLRSADLPPDFVPPTTLAARWFPIFRRASRSAW